MRKPRRRRKGWFQSYKNIGDYRLSFGKYKGKSIKSVPESYINYIIDTFDKDSKIRNLFVKERNRRRIDDKKDDIINHYGKDFYDEWKNKYRK